MTTPAQVKKTKQVRVVVVKDGRRTVAFNVWERDIEIHTHPDGVQTLHVVAGDAATVIKQIPVDPAATVGDARAAALRHAKNHANLNNYETDGVFAGKVHAR